MYEEYFGLKRKPFSIVPDPSYFFMSEGHREGLAHLLYGIQNEGGFVLLTGEVGTGKTTVCRRLLELIPEDVEVAFILNPKMTALELLGTICDEFGIDYPKKTTSIKTLVSRINDYLLGVHEKGRRAVVIIEEAQNLDVDVLEQIRLLTNLETNEKKLLQMIMLGQPELRKILLQPRLRQLSQRITARYHLGPLSKEEVPKYVEHRLAAAGLVRGKLFPPRTMDKLARLTGGVPRLINVICDRALLGAYVQDRSRVDVKTLKRAAREVYGEEGYGRFSLLRYRYAALALLLLLFVGLGILYREPLSGMAMTALRIADREGTGSAGSRGKPGEDVLTVASRPAGRIEALLSSTSNRITDPAKGNLRRPAGRSGIETKNDAYDALFSQWHLKYVAGEDDTLCDQARAAGLECLIDRGGIVDLRRMNKPVVLTLTDEKGGRYYAVLTALRGETATFRIGNETRSVPLREIAGWWAGYYLLLWRQPSGYETSLKPGARGAMVNWLAKHLAVASGQSAPGTEAAVYDRRMAERVKQFQLAYGIVPDGIVGPRTIIGLTGLIRGEDPMLEDPGKKG
jgi:general secretion pathway protein A